MQEIGKKRAVAATTTLENDTLKIGVYTIYDCVLKQFDIPIAIPISKLYDYMNLLVNDVNSKYFNHESDFILNKTGNFNTDTGEIEPHFIERIQTLDKYIDNHKRKLQTIIQTLNFLPTGYYKMPVEQKQAIQEKIDNTITKYIEDYVIPDMDINSSKINQLENKIKSLEDENKNLKFQLDNGKDNDLVSFSKIGYDLLDD